MEQSTTGLTRRQVLKTVAGSSLLLLLPMLPGYAQAADNWKAVGKTADFTAGTPKKVALDGGGVIFVTRTSDTVLSAVSAKCTHRGCAVDWHADDKQFECPCHGAAFAKDGKNLHGPRRDPAQALDPLTSIPARQKDGNVEVNLGAVAPAAVQPRKD